MPETSVPLADLLPLMQERLALGESVQFTPHGGSMRPMLRDGADQVLLSALPEKLKKYDLPLYRREDGHFVLHRVIGVGETYTCIGDDQFTREPGVRREQMIALVTAFTRKGKRYSVTDFRYRLYCRLWHWSRPIRRVALGVICRLRK